jgi:hypothetical protein
MKKTNLDMNADVIFRLLVMIVLVGICAPSVRSSTPEPLARPEPPKVEVRGKPGKRTLYYWSFAKDERGNSLYSAPAVVSNGPEVLSETMAVVITPAKVPGATEYGILSSRCETPRDWKVEVKAKGNRTYYYWFQARNGRTVWASVEGPLKVDGCAPVPENHLSWRGTGAECYYIYRTETPTRPIGWKACGVGAVSKECKFVDKAEVLDFRIVEPDSDPSSKPEGIGNYLVGMTKGDPVIDQGQELKSILIYNFNTTDPVNRPFAPEVKNFVPQGESGAWTLKNDNRMVTPKYSWDVLDGLCVSQRNTAGGLNLYPCAWGTGETAKNTYNGVGVHQYNFTPGQHSAYLAFMFNYGYGDNVMFHGSMEQRGQSRTPGDEGTEFFSLHLTRHLEFEKATVAADAKAGDTYLKISGSLGNVAAGRGLVNITRKYAEGKARVDTSKGTSMVMGTGTNWAPEMEGWFISLDADTVTSGGRPIRQWYPVEKVISPTQLIIRCITYFNHHAYAGRAKENGAYLMCPYTEMLDGDSSTERGLRVIPLTVPWKSGDVVETSVGQAYCQFGCWNLMGDYAAQDWVAGLRLAYTGNRAPNEGALIVYGSPQGNWPAGLECHRVDVGLALAEECKIGMSARKGPKTLIDCGLGEPYFFNLSQDANGFVVGETGGQAWLGLGARGLTLLNQSVIRGNKRTRGQVQMSGDGRTTRFPVKFPTPHETPPFVVACSNLPIGMGIDEVTEKGFQAIFATPPASGQENVKITWMVQE